MADYLRTNFDDRFLGGMYDSGTWRTSRDGRFFSYNGLITDREHSTLARSHRYAEIHASLGIRYVVVDRAVEDLPDTPGRVVYVTPGRARMYDFQRPPRPLVLVETTPSEADALFARP